MQWKLIDKTAEMMQVRIVNVTILPHKESQKKLQYDNLHLSCNFEL